MTSFSEIVAMAKVLAKAVKARPQPRDTRMSLGLMVEQNAAKTPDALMCLFEGKTVTWGQFNTLANRMAHQLKQMGVKKAEVVAVMMDNRIENLVAVTALTKLGAAASMLNNNLTDEPLVHCINSIDSRRIIVGEEWLEPIDAIRGQLPHSSPKDFLFVRDQGKTPCPDWATAWRPDDFPAHNLPETRTIQLKDLAYYIFTSGTTGLPKASVITHDRHCRMAMAFGEIALDMQPTDRIYVCLPLYHSSAMFIGFGSVTQAGASMFLRRKFSASNFLDEARQHNTNCFAYIGELCRYLLLQPQKPDDASNPIKKCVGNGLRPDIWMEFKTRFGIEKICEFYGASEGNAGCVNAFNKDKTVGFCAVKHALVRYDVLNDELIHNRKGFCEKAKKGEPGLMLIEINDKAVFDGYANADATAKKVLQNVFKKGDRYFNTGDLLKQVDVGFALGLPHYQFVDRVGDTYRWKGENVSTNEIGEIINTANCVEYCNLFGVQLPGTDGRAGMAAIIPAGGRLDLQELSRHILDKVPGYARPLFIRQIREMDTTGTFKMKKGDLREQAFHPDKVSEPLFVLKPGSSLYEPLDRAFYDLIMAGKAGY